MSRDTARVASFIALFVVLTSTQVFALHPRTTRHYTRTRYRHHRFIHWNPLLRGSHESLLRQNEEIDRLGLVRIADDGQLEELKQREELVPIRESRSLTIHPGLEAKNRFCRYWTRDFLEDVSDAYYEQFRQPLQVNSAVRTVEQQRRLRRHNHNAAPDSGDTESSHVAGLTVDISKRHMSRQQKKWLEQYMYSLEEAGLLEGAEERRQPVFHIMVSQQYEIWRAANPIHTEIAEQ